jgi:HK97 gp10 family phage protein
MAKRRNYGSISLEGYDELLAAFARVRNVVTEPLMSNEIHAAANIIGDAIKNKIHDVRGNLRKGIIIQRMKKERGGISTIVFMNYKVAPHAHLVEYGVPHDRIAVSKDGQRYMMGDPSLPFGPFWKVGPMPAKPYFRPSVDDNKDRALDKIMGGAIKIIGREFEKN